MISVCFANLRRPYCEVGRYKTDWLIQLSKSDLMGLHSESISLTKTRPVHCV